MAQMIAGPEGLVTETIKRQYVQGLEAAFQQTTAKLQPLFMSQTVDGDHCNFDRIGPAADLVANNVRYGKNPHSEFDFGRRRVDYGYFHQGTKVEPKDLDKVVTDPTSQKMQELVKAVNRKKDKLIIDNIFGAAKTGDNGSTLINFVSTTSGKITVGAQSKGFSNPITTAGVYSLTAGDYEGSDVHVRYDGTGSAGSQTTAVMGMSLAKLRGLRRLWLRLEAISEEDIINIALTSAQMDQLFDINAFVNKDYASRGRMEDGVISSWGNFRFIQSELLHGAGTEADPRQCIAWVARSGKYADKGVKATSWNLTDDLNIPYLYVSLQGGFTRMWGEVTGKINCVD